MAVVLNGSRDRDLKVLADRFCVDLQQDGISILNIYDNDMPIDQQFVRQVSSLISMTYLMSKFLVPTRKHMVYKIEFMYVFLKGVELYEVSVKGEFQKERCLDHNFIHLMFLYL